MLAPVSTRKGLVIECLHRAYETYFTFTSLTFPPPPQITSLVYFINVSFQENYVNAVCKLDIRGFLKKCFGNLVTFQKSYNEIKLLLVHRRAPTKSYRIPVFSTFGVQLETTKSRCMP